jgi:predicted  nucleic acid-binding Zn-ribbon protein
MSTAENTMKAVKKVARVSSRTSSNTGQLEALCQRLLRTQPQSEALLKRLLARSSRSGQQSAFATIEDGRCSACNMRVAIARLQKAKVSEFINCANCIRFLYYDLS